VELFDLQKNHQNGQDRIEDPLNAQDDEEIIDPDIPHKLYSMLLNFNPKVDNIAKNKPIQDMFDQCMSMQPKLIEEIAKLDQKRRELIQIAEEFSNARNSYNRLLQNPTRDFSQGESNQMSNVHCDHNYEVPLSPPIDHKAALPSYTENTLHTLSSNQPQTFLYNPPPVFNPPPYGKPLTPSSFLDLPPEPNLNLPPQFAPSAPPSSPSLFPEIANYFPPSPPHSNLPPSSNSNNQVSSKIQEDVNLIDLS